MRPSQNLPLPSRIYPLLNKFVYATISISTLLPKIYPLFKNYMRPSQKLPSLLEYCPLFNNYIRPSQNLPLPPRKCSTIILCDAPNIYPSLSKYTPFQQLYATLTESTHPSRNIPLPFFTTRCDIPRIYFSVTEYAPFSRNTCTFICGTIYHSLLILKNILGGRGRFWDGRIEVLKRGWYILGGKGRFWEDHSCKFVKKGGIFWEGGVDSGSITYSC